MLFYSSRIKSMRKTTSIPLCLTVASSSKKSFAMDKNHGMNGYGILIQACINILFSRNSKFSITE